MSQAITPASKVRKGELPIALPSEPKPRPALSLLRRILEPIASLRLTVILFSLALFLVFVGTVAQAEAGIWTVVNNYFRTAVAWIPFQVFVKFGQVFLGLPADLQVAGSFPFPGGWLLGGILLANLLAAHAIRFKMNWKRSGIFLIHAGLIVMMLSELITGLYAVEGTMSLMPGEATNFVDDSRVKELAIIKRTGPTTDEVVAIPEAMLRQGEVIRHKALPFDVVVERYMLNSVVGPVDRAPKGTPNPATAGDGLKQVAVERPEVSGADTEQKVDLASAYLTFKRKDNGEKIGTYLVSMWFYANIFNRQLPDRPQKVKLEDGTEYEVYLRPKRTYRPFSIYLIEFRHDRFQGIDKPKNFSSLVRLTDPTENETREVKISMNDPLRYGGETFYQHGVMPGDGGTILQAVRNPGWLMPYISCVMVGVGMLIHFGLHLIGFLRKRAAL